MRFIIISLIYLLHGTQATIKIESLNNAPGLLPVRLGTAMLHDRYKTKIYTYDLAKIEAELGNLNAIWPDLEKLMVNSKELPFLKKKLSNANSRLNNLVLDSRPKRWIAIATGLISIIPKVLDFFSPKHVDTSQYDEVIATLENQQKEVDKLNQQISLFNGKIDQINNELSLINDRQKKLEIEIKTVEQSVKTLQNEVNKYIMIKELVDSTNHQIGLISEMLQDIENAITFAKLGKVHPSVITPEQIFNMINDFDIKDKNLLYSLKLKNMHLFREILEVRSYQRTDKRIVFIISLPIVKEETYDYYQLHSVPVRKEDVFLQLLPPKSYLLAHKDKYILSDSICRNLGEMYYCQNYNSFASKTEMNCLSEIINQNGDYSQCNFYSSVITETQIQPINQQYYLAVAPKSEYIKSKCDVQKVKKLEGTYLIDIPEGCSFTLSTSMYMNNEIDMQKINPVISPPIDWNQDHKVVGEAQEVFQKPAQKTSDFGGFDRGSNTVIYAILGLLSVLQVAQFCYFYFKRRSQY